LIGWKRNSRLKTRYGVQWPDGSITGAITDKYTLAAAYAKSDGGKPYQADANGEPMPDAVLSSAAPIEESAP